jgi:hypothetical protein
LKDTGSSSEFTDSETDLPSDRVRFKLFAAEQHLNRLKEIEKKHHGKKTILCSINKGDLLTELNKVSQKGEWLWLLNELRREMIRKRAVVNIDENINSDNNTFGGG